MGECCATLPVAGGAIASASAFAEILQLSYQFPGIFVDDRAHVATGATHRQIVIGRTFELHHVGLRIDRRQFRMHLALAGAESSSAPMRVFMGFFPFLFRWFLLG
jgi:hypothetical protein